MYGGMKEVKGGPVGDMIESGRPGRHSLKMPEGELQKLGKAAVPGRAVPGRSTEHFRS